MIKQILLGNFKCYQEKTWFELGNINLLTGFNGKGKSTFLQSLLLFRQSVEHNPHTNSLLLNGSCVRLGTFNDVKNAYTSSEDPITILFSVSTGTDNYENTDIDICYTFIKDTEDERKLLLQQWQCQSESKILLLDPSKRKSKKFSAHIKQQKDSKGNDVTDRYENDAQKQEIFHLLLPTVTTILTNDKYSEHWTFQQYLSHKAIHYIGADRLGPQEFYPKSNISDFIHVGKQGEFVADVLSYAQKKQMVIKSSLARSEDKSFLSQASEWLGYILDQPIFSIVLDDNDKYRSSILFKMGDKTYAAPNVGFGYAYILPIIVSGLIAQKNEILIIENPEAHLHPKAQSRLAEFLVQVANLGVQLFIESHSDHILNALRVCVKRKNIEKEAVKVFFFVNDPDSSSPKIYTPNIDDNGRIDEWPEGFFDEWNNNLFELV